MFDTGRTILRAYKDDDLASVLDLWNDAETQPVTFPNDQTVPRQEKFIKDCIEILSKNNSFFAIVEDKETNKFIGEISISGAGARNRDGALGIALGKEWRGKGIGTEITRWIVAYAFKDMGLHRVTLTVVEGNENAIAVYQNM